MSTPCFDERPCFAREGKVCRILHTSYRTGKCPFCKPEREVTKGVTYPFDSGYKQGK